MSEPEGFRDFVSARSAALVRSAWLLTADEATAHDLVQAALEKTWLRWERVIRSALPVRQRAVVVLRYFDDLTEAQVADALGCSVGTVKSQAFKALGRLRACPELREVLSGEEVGHERG